VTREISANPLRNVRGVGGWVVTCVAGGSDVRVIEHTLHARYIQESAENLQKDETHDSKMRYVVLKCIIETGKGALQMRNKQLFTAS